MIVEHAGQEAAREAIVRVQPTAIWGTTPLIGCPAASSASSRAERPRTVVPRSVAVRPISLTSNSAVVLSLSTSICSTSRRTGGESRLATVCC
ncbi:MAG: hypothetical protein Ct9H300mP12_15330 [Acidimicrobiales bacterium]|nr:MAG: hypothetical protein Ct9H300mP12_15330 [Acidimicrobiales bacterium]